MERNMDIEHALHGNHKLALVVALVLSAMVVTVAALIGRGTLNLKGSLFLDTPTPVTVIALTEPRLAEGVHISNVKPLREEPAEKRGEKPQYTYHVQTTDESDYFARLTFDAASARWTLERFEKLHGAE